MASIRTAIELQDNFTSILYQVIDSVNLGLSAMEDLHQTMNSPVDTASIDGARAAIERATIAVHELDAAMQGTNSPDLDSPPVVDQPPPVEVPIHWKAPAMEVFTGNGMDRFQQEVQSANNMLEQLSSTQDAIARQAYNTNIFPPEAFQDLNRMATRIDWVRERIQRMESNPLNIGADAANAELELLRGQLDQAVREQQDLNRAMDDLDVQAANEAYLRLQQIIGDTERHIRDNVDEQGRFNREVEQGTHEANELMRTIGGVVAAYATIQTLTNTLELSDQLTSTMARLDLMNDQLQSTEQLNDMIFLSAQRSRGSYLATADAVSKLGLMAGDAFNSSAEVIAFTEQLNKQFRIAGTEAAGIDAAMLQITQAMGSGVLRGEEYNSVLEQAPNIIQTVADYLGVSVGKLKDMASEGQLTAVILKNALFAAADETNAKFEGMPETFSEIWGDFRDNAIIAFQPVLERMNKIGNSEAFQGGVNGAIEALAVVAGLALETFDLLVAGAGIVADNWSWLAPIIYGVGTALMFYYGAMLLYNAVTSVGTAITNLQAASQALSAGTTFAATAAQYGFNAALMACPITWIVIGIIAFVAAVYVAVAAVNKFSGTSISATGLISGAFSIMGAFIINTCLIPVQRRFAMAANFIGNVFNNPIAAIKVAFYDMCLTVVGYIQKLASAIETLLNKIPGVTVDITSGLDGFYSKLEEAQQAVKDESGWVEYVRKMDFIDYGNAAIAGYSFGKGIDESIANFDPTSLFENNIPNPDDYTDLSAYGAGMGALDGISGGIDDIAGNTGAIADAMEITGEELRYLRDIAEQEAINRFTTAEINIEQTNHNTIKNGMDLDGIMSSMTDMVNEAIDISTEGVHD